MLTDAGSEIYNCKVQAFFKKYNVTHFSMHGDPHGSVVERWNRTLKTKMFRQFTAKNTLKYIDILPTLVKAYHHSFNSCLKKKTVNVTPKNQLEIWYCLYGKQMRTEKKPKCQVGDKVRLNLKIGPFKKGYLLGWAKEVFLVQ